VIDDNQLEFSTRDKILSFCNNIWLAPSKCVHMR
jgi:hypothetical protein